MACKAREHKLRTWSGATVSLSIEARDWLLTKTDESAIGLESPEPTQIWTVPLPRLVQGLAVPLSVEPKFSTAEKSSKA